MSYISIKYKLKIIQNIFNFLVKYKFLCLKDSKNIVSKSTLRIAITLLFTEIITFYWFVNAKRAKKMINYQA